MRGFGASPLPQALCKARLTYIVAPGRENKPAYMDFVQRNEAYHKPWLYHSADSAYYDQYLKRIKRGVTQGCFVFSLETDEMVGMVNINNILLGGIRSASLGYCGDEAHAGQGHMTEGMGLVLKYAFENIGLHRLEANIQPENKRSVRLVQRLGFRQEGFSPEYLEIGGKWCDHERWAILESQKNQSEEIF